MFFFILPLFLFFSQKDFCYNNDPLASFNIPEAIRLCVVVVAFAPESVRSAQMLVSNSSTKLFYNSEIRIYDLTRYTPVRSLPSSNSGSLVPKSAKIWGEQAFAHVGFAFWNNLLIVIKNCISSDSFKCNLKTHLFWDFRPRL